MSIYATISDGIKDAMRAKDRDRLAALRDIKSKLMLEAAKDGSSGEDIADATAMGILSKLYKQRGLRTICGTIKNRMSLSNSAYAACFAAAGLALIPNFISR